MVYNVENDILVRVYDKQSASLLAAYDYNNKQIFSAGSQIVPRGDMSATREIPLPDLYGDAKGWTCTGLSYNDTNGEFLVGDIGMQQPGGTIHSQIVRLSKDFKTILGTIPLSGITSNDVQGIALGDESTIWMCVPSDNKVYHITYSGTLLGYISVARPTGVSYDSRDGTLWVLTMDNKIINLGTNGTSIASHNFAYQETLDQCFLDVWNGLLYITAGTNYQSRNNIYIFNTVNNTQSVACTVDSYSVEGIFVDGFKMYILNDGYYHSAIVPVNQVNIYNLYTPYVSIHAERNMWGGGYVEIQPDSWDGSTPVTGDVVSSDSPTAWGFPMSLSAESKAAIKNEILSGRGYGISFIRFPMGFGYRGYRNIDTITGLAKNIGERWSGQNYELSNWFSEISKAGGGLSVEYWCPAPYWITGGAYYNSLVENELWAGGNYSRTTTLRSIKTSDPTQYWAQIDAYTDAVVDDLEYVHQNVAPVRMYTLAAEPTGSGMLKYGHCHWTSELYNDVFGVLSSKVSGSTILNNYDGSDNVVLMHLCADDTGFDIGQALIGAHPEKIWGYSHDVMRPVSGENGSGADTIKNLSWPSGSSTLWKNVFICEYEYFNPESKTEDYRFSNNVVRLILELAYRKARVIMPVIHICKPMGQNQSQTNTVGYCLYAVDMETGNYTTNTWAYNSWKMFNDNLPIGSEVVSGGDDGQSNCGYVILKYGDDLFVLLGNYSATQKSITLTFDKDITLNGKLYSKNLLGDEQGIKSGSVISFVIPAYSGLVYTTE